MLSSNNILSPANGQPIAIPTQDIVLGCYYLTKEKKGTKGEGRAFAWSEDVLIALEHREVETLTPIRLLYTGELIDLTTVFDDQDVIHTETQKVKNQILKTTVGRVILNDQLPKGDPLHQRSPPEEGPAAARAVLLPPRRHREDGGDARRHQGPGLHLRHQGRDFHRDRRPRSSRRARSAWCIGAQKEVMDVEKQYLDGAITNGERYNKVISIWSSVTEKVADAMFKEMEKQDKEGQEFNPIYIMADSGARGSKQQIRQLAGMRGLMARPSGEIIENPITSNFREGLTVLQYFISTHGARKGLADTALKTADSGYLTRRLVDVSQDVIISDHDCGTVDGIDIRPIIESGEVIEPLRDRIVGRVSLEKIKDIEGQVIVEANQEITEETANAIQGAGIEKVRIRSVLTCESLRGVCALCYGRDLATGKLVEMGLAVGVIAAQSIGEPGTQLTMRTFHIGGTASHTTQQTTLEAKNAGTLKFHNLTTVKNKKGDLVVMNRAGALVIQDQKGRERERHAVVYGATLKVKEGAEVKQGQLLVEWDPYSFTILTEDEGQISFKDLIEGQTFHEQVDENTGMAALVIMESPDEKKQPRIEIKDEKGKSIKQVPAPVGGPPDGRGRQRGRGRRRAGQDPARDRQDQGHHGRSAPRGRAVRGPAAQGAGGHHRDRRDGEVRRRGQAAPQDLRDRRRRRGPRVPAPPRRPHQRPGGRAGEGGRAAHGRPHRSRTTSCSVRGEKELQRYLVDEIQEVYRLQGVNINDKHIEVIARQMMRWVKVEDVGDTEFLIDEVVDKFRFMTENEPHEPGRQEAGHRPSAAPRHHQGVALHRLLHLRGQLPGDDARPHRGRHQRQGRLPPRPQGERDHGPAHPRRYRHGVLPPHQDPRRGGGAAGEAGSRATTRPSTWWSRSTSRTGRRSEPLLTASSYPRAARAARHRRPFVCSSSTGPADPAGQPPGRNCARVGPRRRPRGVRMRSNYIRLPLRAGARLGPYHVVGPLGVGGMGEVYRARDTRLGRGGDIRYQGTTLGQGPLPNDRTHQFKLYGTWAWRELTIGLGFRAGSGQPLTALAANPAYEVAL